MLATTNSQLGSAVPIKLDQAALAPKAQNAEGNSAASLVAQEHYIFHCC